MNSVEYDFSTGWTEKRCVAEFGPSWTQHYRALLTRFQVWFSNVGNMNAHVSIKQTIDADAFHCARSLCLDAFATIESAINARLSRGGIDPGKSCLSQKIEMVKKIGASPSYSKARKAEVHEVLTQIESLIDHRNDIVHARLGFALIDGEQLACFANTRQATSVSLVARLFTIERLSAMGLEAESLGRKLLEP
jgi:hypothetical protein